MHHGYDHTCVNIDTEKYLIMPTIACLGVQNTSIEMKPIVRFFHQPRSSFLESGHAFLCSGGIERLFLMIKHLFYSIKKVQRYFCHIQLWKIFFMEYIQSFISYGILYIQYAVSFNMKKQLFLWHFLQWMLIVFA